MMKRCGSLIIEADNSLLSDALACGYVRTLEVTSVPQAVQSWRNADFIVVVKPVYDH